MTSTLFGLLALWPAALLAGAAASEVPPVKPQIDHILIGVADLDRGVEEMFARTGVRPAYGGKHPGGTHNALLSLGGHTYLELIALQPGAAPPAGMEELRRLHVPTPVGWAVSTGPLAAFQRTLGQDGFALSAPAPGSRVTPAGDTLRWQTLGLTKDLQQAPFFIDWSPDTAHPSTTAPGGCSLRHLHISTPDAGELQRLRDALHLPVEIKAGKAPAYSVTLDCPKGPVTFTGG